MLRQYKDLLPNAKAGRYTQKHTGTWCWHIRHQFEHVVVSSLMEFAHVHWSCTFVNPQVSSSTRAPTTRCGGIRGFSGAPCTVFDITTFVVAIFAV